MSFNFSTKTFFSAQNSQKPTLGLILHVPSSATRDGKGNCISGRYLLASLLIINRIVNNLSEPVTLKPLFRRIPNLTQLYLAKGETFTTLRSAKSVNVIKYRRKKAIENHKKLKSLKHFYKKLTLKVKSYKNGKKALKVMSSFLTEKQILVVS